MRCPPRSISSSSRLRGWCSSTLISNSFAFMACMASRPHGTRRRSVRASVSPAKEISQTRVLMSISLCAAAPTFKAWPSVARTGEAIIARSCLRAASSSGPRLSGHARQDKGAAWDPPERPRAEAVHHCGAARPVNDRGRGAAK